MEPDGIQADNLLAILPTIGNLTGAGTVDSKNALDFKMLAILTKEASSTAGSVGAVANNAADALGGFLGSVTGSGSGAAACSTRGGGRKVPFQIQRSTPAPK